MEPLFPTRKWKTQGYQWKESNVIPLKATLNSFIEIEESCFVGCRTLRLQHSLLNDPGVVYLYRTGMVQNSVYLYL